MEEISIKVCFKIEDMSEKRKYKKVGLALGSGGWRGLAHLGVIKALLKYGIPIDYIAGSSAGALMGGMYDALKDIDRLEEIMGGLGYKDLARALSDPYSSSGILKGEKMVSFLKRHVGDKKVEELEIPFGAVTTDLKTGKTIVLKKGGLVEGIRASMSVPLVFEPVKYGKKLLVDGGTSTPVPVRIVKEMGAEVVIGVNLYGHAFPIKNWKNGKLGRMEVAKLSYHLVLHQLAKRDVEEADLVIEPKVIERGISFLSKIVHNKEAIKRGEESVEEMIEEIRKLIEY